MKTAAVLILLSGYLAGCTAAIDDPVDGTLFAKCYDGVLISFCQVKQPAGTAIVSAGGVIPVTGSLGIATAIIKP